MGLTIQQVASRAFLLLGTTGPLFATYFWINQRNSVEHAPLTMPDWVPFLPILALPYLALLWTPTLGIQNSRGMVGPSTAKWFPWIAPFAFFPVVTS